MRKDSFPIVCIGMSAGAIAPLKKVFERLSSTTGMAFVVIHHLRQFPTHLPVIIGHSTRMPVHLAADGQQVQANHVYVLPSGAEIKLLDGQLSVTPASKKRGWSNVISVFLRSLVESRHPGIAVILSGVDRDGSDALAEFERNGGVVIAQQPQTAIVPEMPKTAIATGTVDYVLRPEAIAGQLENSAKALAHAFA